MKTFWMCLLFVGAALFVFEASQHQWIFAAINVVTIVLAIQGLLRED